MYVVVRNPTHFISHFFHSAGHGAGGLAAQYQFGARGGSSIIFLGFMKVIFSILSGSTVSTFLGNYPNAILGVLLFFSGLGLSKAGVSHPALHIYSSDDNCDDRRSSELMVILATASATVGLKTGWGCFFGICFSLFYGGFDHVLEDFKRWIRMRKKWYYYCCCCCRCYRSAGEKNVSSEFPETVQNCDEEARATKGSSSSE